MKQKVAAREYSREIIMHAEEHNQRTGQYLFNSLPVGASKCVTGSLFDPFYQDMSQYQVETWLHEHVIFDDDGKIIGLFNDNTILWARGENWERRKISNG